MLKMTDIGLFCEPGNFYIDPLNPCDTAVITHAHADHARVMVPNVYGMGSFADGGIFSTKPYICGSSYLLRMSNYSKGEWCDIVDGLYWRFINNNIKFFETNPRLSLMTRALEKIDRERKKMIFEKAENFIKNNTH